MNANELNEFFTIRDRYRRELGDAFLCNTWQSIRMSAEQRDATRRWVEQRQPTLELDKYESKYHEAYDRVVALDKVQRARNR